MSAPRRFRASAPSRLDFAGGWTDVAPFAERERGVVVNAAIELRARAEVLPGGAGSVRHADEVSAPLVLEGPAALRGNGTLDLHKAALRMAGAGPCTLHTRSEAPAGSGLGSSGALDVALVAAIDAWQGRMRPPLELAEDAFRLESVEAALPGGRQDQYAAALGGFNRLEFRGGRVDAEPLVLDPGFTDQLARSLVVCYTGTSRVSSRTISRVMQAYTNGDSRVERALHGMVETAERMADALRAADLARVGSLLSVNWSLQQQLDPGMRTESMAGLEEAMRATGAVGGKAAGAGAGGSMFFLVPAGSERAAEAARRAGARVLDVAWAAAGVRVGEDA